MNKNERIAYAIKKQCSEYSLVEWCNEWGFTIDDLNNFLNKGMETGFIPMKKIREVIKKMNDSIRPTSAITYENAIRKYSDELINTMEDL